MSTFAVLRELVQASPHFSDTDRERLLGVVNDADPDYTAPAEPAAAADAAQAETDALKARIAELEAQQQPQPAAPAETPSA